MHHLAPCACGQPAAHAGTITSTTQEIRLSQQRNYHIRRIIMVELIVQIVVVSLWGAMIAIHTRRLLRLARIEAPVSLRGRQLRQNLSRVWWWLGREEFWRAVQIDGLRCTQITVMLFLLALGLLVE
jgi:hypothetical protein